MGGKRSAEPSGKPEGKVAADGQAVEEGGSCKRQALGLVVHGGARSADPPSNRQEQLGSISPSHAELARSQFERPRSDAERSESIVAPWAVAFSMRCDSEVEPCATGTFAGQAPDTREKAKMRAPRKAEFEAALRKLVTEFGGEDFKLEQIRLGPSEHTLKTVMEALVLRLEPEVVALCLGVCKTWRRVLEVRGLCNKTVQLCSALSEGGLRQQNPLQPLNASTDPVQAQGWSSDASAFQQRSWGWKGSLHEWLQAASQEPDASFLSGGAASSAKSLGMELIQWVGKPQGRYPGLRTLTNFSSDANCVAVSPDGKYVASGSQDKLVKCWNAETGALVSILGVSAFRVVG